jgi:N-methylhydantoinase B
VLRWRVESKDVQCVTVGSGMLEKTRAFGLFGGKPGSLPIMRIVGSDGAIRKLPLNQFSEVKAGDVFELVSQGGGGFGDPFMRSADRVRDDVANGLVSMEKAVEDYGVVLERHGRDIVIDQDATAKKRAARTKS